MTLQLKPDFKKCFLKNDSISIVCVEVYRYSYFDSFCVSRKGWEKVSRSAAETAHACLPHSACVCLVPVVHVIQLSAFGFTVVVPSHCSRCFSLNFIKRNIFTCKMADNTNGSHDTASDIPEIELIIKVSLAYFVRLTLVGVCRARR